MIKEEKAFDSDQDTQYHLLLKEYDYWDNQLFKSGAGIGIVERALIYPCIVERIEENEKLLGKQKIRAIVVEVVARYLILSYVNRSFFSFAGANHAFKALFNNCIDDEDRNWWAMSLNQVGRSDRCKPEDLERLINELFDKYPALRGDLNS